MWQLRTTPVGSIGSTSPLRFEDFAWVPRPRAEPADRDCRHWSQCPRRDGGAVIIRFAHSKAATR